MHRPTHCPASRPAADRGLFVWFPWLCAPGFLLLPIGGCGMAATLRRPAAAATARAEVPVATVATVMPSNRSVAWPHAAD